MELISNADFIQLNYKIILFCDFAEDINNEDNVILKVFIYIKEEITTKEFVN